MNHHIQTLELHKILERLADEASNEATKELARNLTPCTNLEDVSALMQKTEDALNLSIQYGTPAFYNFKNVCNSLARASSGARLSLKELLQIKQLLSQIQALSDWYSHCENVETTLSDFFTRLMPQPALLEKLDRSILSEDEIADSASTTLADIRRKIARAGIHLRETLDKMIKSGTMQKYLQESIVTMRDGRYVLPVKAEHRGNVQGLIHDTSATGQTYFIEPMSIVEANNDIRLLESKEQEEIDRILTNLCAECGSMSEVLCASYAICVELNLYFAKANLGARMHASRPILSDNGVIELKKARHPLIDPNQVVPIDLSIGEQYQALIITGPNTGGKTVALKTVGLLTAMAMCGLLLPVADGSKISVFERILVDIGDAQSIEQNLSTFSAHTNHVIDILRQADDHSLVLLDELGSGTDPVEGAALAVSVIEQLKRQGAKLMATTHYQELKLYAIETPDVENASCEFDLNTLRPTYRLILGSPGKSNAFAISRQLGMPEEIIEYAKSLVSTEQSRFETVVEQLEAARIELEEQNRALRTAKMEAEQSAAKLKEELEYQTSHRDAELEKARLKANQIIEMTKAESNRLLDELNQLRHEKEKAEFAKNVSAMKGKTNQSFNALYDLANPVNKPKVNAENLPRPLKKGDYVTVIDLDKQGTVLSEADASGMIFVQMGSMKTKVPVSRLRLDKPPAPQNQQQKFKRATGKKNGVTVKGTSRANRSAMMELDIRGYNADEGCMELDAFIDNAVMSGMNMVTVIHGKGTGILRQAIHRRLRMIPNVKSFRLGLFGEGEDGVTIVELK
ncbi:MAG: endonuclease MutS2 [Ruminococcus sp.]|nr:endonuclease MutS2 [Ruminococcus sp.]